jgi:recombination protein RecA
MASIEKQYGKGAVMKMGDKGEMTIEAIPTGALALDLALGVGGLPRGRVVEIFGPESSGKSTLAMHAVAEAQRNGGICAYIDAEHAMDPVYARAIGVDVDELLISQPDTGEQALEITDMLIRSGALDIVVIDSVAALTPRAEIEGEMGDSHMGLQARLMSQALRKLTANLNKTNTICIFINQLREKIGVMFGSPETTPGGRALKFYSSVRLDIRRIESIKDGAEMVGNRTRVKVVKNKVAPPFRQAEFDIMYGKGISREGSLLDVGVDLELIKKAGAWFTYEGEQLGQGRENAKNFLGENPEIMMDISERILAQVGINRDGDATTRDDADLTDIDEPISLDDWPASNHAQTSCTHRALALGALGGLRWKRSKSRPSPTRTRLRAQWLARCARRARSRSRSSVLGRSTRRSRRWPLPGAMWRLLASTSYASRPSPTS